MGWLGGLPAPGIHPAGRHQDGCAREPLNMINDERRQELNHEQGQHADNEHAAKLSEFR